MVSGCLTCSCLACSDSFLLGPAKIAVAPSLHEFRHTDWGVDMYLFSLGSESPKGAIGHIVPTEKTILAVEENKVLLPPLWNRTFSWGFDDFSCCLGSYGSDKVSGIRASAFLQLGAEMSLHQ